MLLLLDRTSCVRLANDSQCEEIVVLRSPSSHRRVVFQHAEHAGEFGRIGCDIACIRCIFVAAISFLLFLVFFALGHFLEIGEVSTIDDLQLFALRSFTILLLLL